MSEASVGLWLGLCLGLLVALVAWGVTTSTWKADAVQRGLAMYCSDDGQ